MPKAPDAHLHGQTRPDRPPTSYSLWYQGNGEHLRETSVFNRHERGKTQKTKLTRKRKVKSYKRGSSVLATTGNKQKDAWDMRLYKAIILTLHCWVCNIYRCNMHNNNSTKERERNTAIV